MPRVHQTRDRTGAGTDADVLDTRARLESMVACSEQVWPHYLRLKNGRVITVYLNKHQAASRSREIYGLVFHDILREAAIDALAQEERKRERSAEKRRQRVRAAEEGAASASRHKHAAATEASGRVNRARTTPAREDEAAASAPALTSVARQADAVAADPMPTVLAMKRTKQRREQKRIERERKALAIVKSASAACHEQPTTKRASAR